MKPLLDKLLPIANRVNNARWPCSVITPRLRSLIQKRAGRQVFHHFWKGLREDAPRRRANLWRESNPPLASSLTVAAAWRLGELRFWGCGTNEGVQIRTLSGGFVF